MSPMIGSIKVSVVDERVPHRDVEIAFGPPGQGVKALVHVIARNAPEQPFWLKSVAFHDAVGDHVQRRERENV